jgi:hypothetical protein
VTAPGILLLPQEQTSSFSVIEPGFAPMNANPQTCLSAGSRLMSTLIQFAACARVSVPVSIAAGV